MIVSLQVVRTYAPRVWTPQLHKKSLFFSLETSAATFRKRELTDFAAAPKCRRRPVKACSARRARCRQRLCLVLRRRLVTKTFRRAAVIDIFGCLDITRWEATSAKFLKQIRVTDCKTKSLKQTLLKAKRKRALGQEAAYRDSGVYCARVIL